MLAKHQLSLKQVLVTTVLFLFIAILLTSITSKMVLATSIPTINLNPAQGPPGATIYISGEGFPLGSTETIKINSAQVGTAQETTRHLFSGQYVDSLSGYFTVPSDAQGTYQVTISDASGDYGTAQFTITAPEATPSPTSSSSTSPSSTSSSSSNTGLTPTYTPFVYPSLQPQNAGMSPLVIGLIVVVVAVVIIVPLMFMFRSRSPKREVLLEKAPMPYRQDPYSQPPTNQPASPINPPTSRYSSPRILRYEQSSTRYSQVLLTVATLQNLL